MNNRAELDRLVRMLSEAEVHTVLKFIQFLEQGHVRPRIGDPRGLMKQASVIIDDIVEIVDTSAQPVVELSHAPQSPALVAGNGRPLIDRQGPRILDDAIKVPQAEWAVTLEGFSHMFHDLDCHLSVLFANGNRFTIARDMPLGQVYFDEKGSERNAVQVALNRSGTVFSDFRYIHRIGEPQAIYIRDAEKDGLVDLIVESEGQHTLLETSIPDSSGPGVRRLAFLGLIKARLASRDRFGLPRKFWKAAPANDVTTRT